MALSEIQLNTLNKPLTSNQLSATTIKIKSQFRKQPLTSNQISERHVKPSQMSEKGATRRGGKSAMQILTRSQRSVICGGLYGILASGEWGLVSGVRETIFYFPGFGQFAYI